MTPDLRPVVEVTSSPPPPNHPSGPPQGFDGEDAGV